MARLEEQFGVSSTDYILLLYYYVCIVLYIICISSIIVYITILHYHYMCVF